MDMNVARSIVAACGTTLSMYGCATSSKDIAPAYISPVQYQSYDCDQIAAEVQRIQARVTQLGGRLDQAASNDAGIMAVGLILFWPVLFALGGTKQQEAEYARLRGEYDALEQQATLKKCQRATTASAPAATPAGQAAAQSALANMPGSAPATPEAVSPAPALVPVADMRATTEAPKPVTTSTTVPAQGSSKYMFNAERFAKGGNYSQPVATMNIRMPSYETFTITCANGEPRSIRCDADGCKELR